MYESTSHRGDKVAELVSEYLKSEANHRLFTGGRSHASGVVEFDRQKYFVKLCLDEKRLPRIANEFEWLQAVFRVDPGIVPRPLAFVKQNVSRVKAFLITENVSGVSLINRASDNGELPLTLLSGYAVLLQRFHELPILSREIRFDGEVWDDWRTFISESASTYLRDIERLGGVLPDGLKENILSIIERHREDLTTGPVGPIHGDPTPANVLLDESGHWRLIDLEVAHNGDPLMDLAIAGLLSLDSIKDAWPAFLQAYGVSWSDGVVRRIGVYKVVRQIRILRGKLWIYKDPQAFIRETEKLCSLVENMLSNKAGY